MKIAGECFATGEESASIAKSQVAVVLLYARPPVPRSPRPGTRPVTFRRTFAVLALASWFVIPAVAGAAIVQKWRTPNGVSYGWVDQVSGDINGDGSYEMVTVEAPVAGLSKIGIRSGSTGALLTQTAGSYAPSQFLIGSVDGISSDIFFTDIPTGNLNCLHYALGALSLRFSFRPTPNGVPSEWKFADLDGNGHLYMVFKDEAPLSNNYYVRDNTGTLVATLNPAGAPSGGGWSRHLSLDDYDGDGRQEILITYRNQSVGDVLYVYENNSPPVASAAKAPGVPNPAQVDGRAGSSAPSNRFGLASRRSEPVYVRGSR